MAVTIKPHLLAGDSWLPVVGGLKHVNDVHQGDKIFLVKPDGTISTSTVSRTRRADAPVRCVALLTRIGEFLLPPGTRIVTRNGSERIEDVVFASRRNEPVRIEVVPLGDLLPGSTQSGSQKTGYAAALAVLSRRRVIVPGWLEQGSSVCDEIEALLATATASTFIRHSLDSWCVFDIDPPELQDGVSPPWWRTDVQAHALMLLAAWAVKQEKVVARVLSGDVRYLQRLCGCLAATGAAYEVRWLPGYRPVEARVLRVANRVVGSHVPVLRAVTREQYIYRLEVADAGSVIVGGALVS